MTDATTKKLLSSRREKVLQSYKSAKATNENSFVEGDVKATSEYIYPNQMEDAVHIINEFYKNNRRAISIQKKTKVGADGLMIAIAMLMTTHPDDKFVVDPSCVRILTGMSNAAWEKDMIDKAPDCFRDKIFHHGKLSKAALTDMKNALFIFDEIDTGDKENQVLHKTLRAAGILDVKHMEENNNRFVFISATMIKELYDTEKWGSLHKLYIMTIPDNYFGHQDFLEHELVKEFYPLTSNENVDKWIQEDILPYGSDYRVHIVRVNNKMVDIVHNACVRKGILFSYHTSNERLTPEQIKELFTEPLINHIVLCIKGFFRRANLIPNTWKIRIGATHELYTKTVDNNVQIQGLTGRMTGYWRDIIEGGHRTGPHRTSIQAIEEYETIYHDPFGKNTYQSSGFSKVKGKVSASTTMLTPKNIKNMTVSEVETNDPQKIAHPIPFNTPEEAGEFLRTVLQREVNPRAFITIDGYVISTRLNLYYKKKRDQLVANDRLTLERYHEIAVGSSLSSTGNGSPFMVYPVYADMESKDVSYYVRYVIIPTPELELQVV